MRSTIFYKSGIMCPEGDGGAKEKLPNQGTVKGDVEGAPKVDAGKQDGTKGGKMKLEIKIDEKSYIESFLSIVSLGALECIEKGIISCEEAMKIIYFPGMIEKLEELFPGLGEAIHLGTELEDVVSIIPEKLKVSIDQIRVINYTSIKLGEKREQHVFYSLNEGESSQML